jgi:ectoine hydroxylase-related dioxygenase (phytanoyl-CoA dioxygenase family)
VPHRGFPVDWHQDPVVIKRFPAFNIDVYLDDSDEDNACVWAIPGSHLGGYHAPAGGDAQRYIESWTNGCEGKDVPGAVPVCAQRGDVLVHATSVLHGSWWNRSNRMRRTIYYHFDSWEDVNLGGGYASRSSEEAAKQSRPT